jgi:hypothetical protein
LSLCIVKRKRAFKNPSAEVVKKIVIWPVEKGTMCLLTVFNTNPGPNNLPSPHHPPHPTHHPLKKIKKLFLNLKKKIQKIPYFFQTYFQTILVPTNTVSCGITHSF